MIAIIFSYFLESIQDTEKLKLKYENILINCTKQMHIQKEDLKHTITYTHIYTCNN